MKLHNQSDFLSNTFPSHLTVPYSNLDGRKQGVIFGDLSVGLSVTMSTILGFRIVLIGRNLISERKLEDKTAEKISTIRELAIEKFLKMLQHG